MKIEHSKYQYFDIDEPHYMQRVEGYEVQAGTPVYAAVLFEYSVCMGLEPVKLVWLDLDANVLDLSQFSFSDQVWLHEQISKTANIHASTYFDKAYNHYERGE